MTDEPMDGSVAGTATERAGPRRRTGFWLLLVALVCLCLFALYRSPLWRLSAVEVTGLNRLTKEQVVEVAGLRPGIFRLELSAAAIERRLAMEPWIKSARATWVRNQVSVTLTEREPVGLVRYHDLFYLTLDETGVVLEQTTLGAAKGIPVISGVQVEKGLRGQRLTHQGLLDALSVLSWMGPSFTTQVSEVSVDTERSLTLYMAGGATVLWGTVPDGKNRDTLIQQKWKDFGGVWQNLPRRRSPACRVDLRVESNVIPSGCS